MSDRIFLSEDIHVDDLVFSILNTLEDFTIYITYFVKL